MVKKLKRLSYLLVAVAVVLASLASINLSNNITNLDMFVFDCTAWLDNQPDGEVYINDIFIHIKVKLLLSLRLMRVQD